MLDQLRPTPYSNHPAVVLEADESAIKQMVSSGSDEIELAEDAMANQATGARQCRLNVGGGAVDRAVGLQAEEIGGRSSFTFMQT